VDAAIPSMGEACWGDSFQGLARQLWIPSDARGFGRGRRFLLADARATIACLPCSKGWKGKAVYGRGSRRTTI
jgi:hypothetical protein